MDSKNKEFWEEFIHIYRQHSCLWDIKSKDYANKIKRNSSYNELLKKYREICPNATVDTLKKKINNIRTIFRRELKKVQDSRGTGTGTDDIYEPTLWYYDELLFTAHCETGRKGRTTDDSDVEENTQENYSADEGEQEIGDFDDQSQPPLLSPAGSSHSVEPPSAALACSTASSNDTPSSSRPSSRSTISRKKSKSKRNDVEEKKKAALLDLAHKALVSDDDEYTVVGKRVAFQLQSLAENQRITAEKLISDVMYYAKLGKLNENSRVDPFITTFTVQSQSFGSSMHSLQHIQRQPHIFQQPAHVIPPTYQMPTQPAHAIPPTQQMSSQPCHQARDNAPAPLDDVSFSLSEYMTFPSHSNDGNQGQ